MPPSSSTPSSIRLTAPRASCSDGVHARVARRELGAAAQAGPVARDFGRRGAREEAAVLAARHPHRAHGTAIDARRRDADEEAAVEARIVRGERAVAGVGIERHGRIMRARRPPCTRRFRTSVSGRGAPRSRGPTASRSFADPCRATATVIGHPKRAWGERETIDAMLECAATRWTQASRDSTAHRLTGDPRCLHAQSPRRRSLRRSLAHFVTALAVALSAATAHAAAQRTFVSPAAPTSTPPQLLAGRALPHRSAPPSASRTPAVRSSCSTRLATGPSPLRSRCRSFHRPAFTPACRS